MGGNGEDIDGQEGANANGQAGAKNMNQNGVNGAAGDKELEN